MATVISQVQQPCHVQKTAFHSLSSNPHSLTYFLLLPYNASQDSCVLEGGIDAACFQQFDPLQVFALTSDRSLQKEVYLTKVASSTIYGVLECCLPARSFSKTAVSSYLTPQPPYSARAYDLPNHEHKTKFKVPGIKLFCGTGLISNQEVFGCRPVMALLCQQVGWYCSMVQHWVGPLMSFLTLHLLPAL